MAASTAPRKRTAKKMTAPPPPPTAGDISTIQDFRRPNGEAVLLPSGRTVMMKRPGMQQFLAASIIPNTLRPIIDRAVRKGQGLKPMDEKALMDKASDPEALEEMMSMLDRVTALSWISPPVCYHRREFSPGPGKPTEWEDIPEAERDLESYVYTDELDLEDKSFTFNFAVGGVRDLERFRQQLGSSVVHVRGSESLEVSAE